MTSILEEFAYGNVSPKADFKRNSDYSKAMEFVSHNKQKLLEQLEGENKATFEKYVAMQDELNQLTAVNNQIYGYKLGLIMTAESFIGMDDLYFNGNE